MDDFHTIVEYIIQNYLNLQYYDINTVYSNKYKLSDILKKTIVLTQRVADFDIINSIGNNYTGNSTRLDKLGINLDGFESSLKKYIQLYRIKHDGIIQS
jgi:hypothetical protein